MRSFAARLVACRAWYLALCLAIPWFVPLFAERAPGSDPVRIPWQSEWAPEYWRHFETFDGSAYLILARYGYQANSAASAFYPAWPMAIRAAASLLGSHWTLTGVILGNALSLGGLWLFYVLVRERHGAVWAERSVLLLLAMPGAFFLAMPYSETLFLPLLMVFWLGMVREKPLWAAGAGFFLPMTRPIGWFVLCPLVWRWVEDAWRSGAGAGRRWRRFGGRLLRHPLLPVVPVVLAGWAFYFGIMALWTGDPFAAFVAEKAYTHSPSIRHLFDLPAFAKAFVEVRSLVGGSGSLLGRLLFVLLVVALPGMWRLDRTYFWWGLTAGVLPAMGTWFISYERFVLLVFPLFIVLAVWMDQPQRRRVVWVGAVIGATLQFLCLVRHMSNLPVA